LKGFITSDNYTGEKTMKAVQIAAHGDSSAITIVEKEKPQAEAGKILVKMRFGSVNPCDMDVVHGYLPFAKTPPIVLGVEGAGVVEEGNEAFPKGTPVIVSGGLLGIIQDGVWQQYVSLPPELLYKVPPGMTLEEAAVLPMVYLTGQAALVEGGFTAGMSVLVTGAGGGVGNAAYQLALLQGASNMIATVGSPEKKVKLLDFIDRFFRRPIVWSSVVKGQFDSAKIREIQERFKSNVIDLSSENLEERITAITEGKGVNFVIDVLGGTYFPRLLNILTPMGTLMLVGYRVGLDTQFNIMPVLAKQIRIFGTNVFNLSPEAAQKAMATVSDLAQKHAMKPVIDKRFELEDVAEANRYLAEKRPFGKVVIKLD
jgi:NADPH:quinone reductase